MQTLIEVSTYSIADPYRKPPPRCAEPEATVPERPPGNLLASYLPETNRKEANETT